MPAPLPRPLPSFIGRLVGARHGVTTVRCTTLVGYSSFLLLVAIWLWQRPEQVNQDLKDDNTPQAN